MTPKPRKPLLVNLTWAAVFLVGLAVLYVLSYAPAVRLMGREFRIELGVQPSGQHMFVGVLEYPDDAALPVYKPVGWMTRETPLQPMLLWWERLWGVQRVMPGDLDRLPRGVP